MATYTPNYNLIKPDYEEPADVAQLNNNADLIDAALSEKQDTLTFDSAPTSGSANPVTSGGVYTGLAGKVSKSGDTMTGDLILTKSNNYPSLLFNRWSNPDSNPIIMIQPYGGANYAQLWITQRINSSSAWDMFKFPATDTSASTNREYYILTTKPGAGYAYAAGDTFSMTSIAVLPAVLIGSAKNISVSVYTPKSLASISSVTVTSFNGGARYPSGGFVGSGNAASPWVSSDSFQWVGASGITISTYKVSDNWIKILFTSSTAFTAGNTTTALANNIPISFHARCTLSFS